MNRIPLVCIASLGVLLCLLFGHGAASAPQQSAGPVALVYSLAGEATLTLPTGGRHPLRLFDRLPEGTTVEAGPGSRLALAFANGRRYELGEKSRVTLGRSDLASRSGLVRPLPRVPPLPRILPIAEEEHPGLSAGAVRIRAERITGLYPRNGAATLAGATNLRFQPVDGAGKYRIEVQDRQGNVVFATETTASPVKLPSGSLKPGMRYGWTVRTIERVGPVARGEADFATLPSRLAEEREALRRAVETAGDGALLALLAEVDRSLGLLAEAREELQAAVRASPDDAALAASLAELQRRLEDESPEPFQIRDLSDARFQKWNASGRSRRRHSFYFLSLTFPFRLAWSLQPATGGHPTRLILSAKEQGSRRNRRSPHVASGASAARALPAGRVAARRVSSHCASPPGRLPGVRGRHSPKLGAAGRSVGCIAGLRGDVRRDACRSYLQSP